MKKRTPNFGDLLIDQQNTNQQSSNQPVGSDEAVDILKEGLTSKEGDGLNANILKLTQVLKESIRVQNQITKKVDGGGKSAGRPYLPGYADWERGQAQKMGSMSYWLGVTPESQGLLSDLVRRREARQEFVKSAMNMSNMSQEEATEKFNQLNRVRGKRQETEELIEKLKKQGFSGEDIRKYRTAEGPNLFELQKRYTQQEQEFTSINAPAEPAAVDNAEPVVVANAEPLEKAQRQISDLETDLQGTAAQPIPEERFLSEEEQETFNEIQKHTNLLGSMDIELKGIHETIKNSFVRLEDIISQLNMAGAGLGGLLGGMPDIGGTPDVDGPDKDKSKTGGKPKSRTQRFKDFFKGSKAGMLGKVGGGALAVVGAGLAISEAVSDIADLDEKLEAGLTYIDDQIKHEEISPEEGQELKDAWYQQIAVEKAGEKGEAAGTITGGLAGAAAGAAAGLAAGPLAPIASPILGIAGGIGGAIYGGDWGKDIAKWTTSPGPKQQAVNEQIAGRIQEEATSKEKVKGGLAGSKISTVTEDMSLSDFISVGESKGDYNIYNMGEAHKYKVGHEDLSQMTLDEVMRRQNLDPRSSQKLFAVGKHQIIPKTMEAAKRAMGLTGEEKFTPELQERIFAEYLTQEKRPAIENFIKGKGDIDKAALAIGQEWASVGVSEKGGRSYYDKDGVNKAHVSPEQAKNALNVAKKRYEDAIAAGKSEADAYREAVLGMDKVESKEKPASSADGYSRVVGQKEIINGKEQELIGYTDDMTPIWADPGTTMDQAKKAGAQTSNLMQTDLVQAPTPGGGAAQSKAEPIDARSAGFFGTGETVADRSATEESWGPDKDWATEAKPVDYKPAGVVPQAALNLEQKMLLAADKPKTADEQLEDEFDKAIFEEEKNIAEYDIQKNQEAKQKAEAIRQRDLQGLPQVDVVGERSFQANPLPAQPLSSAEDVYKGSVTVSDAERDLKASSAASLVNAPTVNNVSSQNVVNPPGNPRNTDSAWQRYSNFAYGWGVT